MRERSTWNLEEIAIAKRAAEVAGDIYSMNQDHPQPAMDEYVIGDSSDFAEDVHEPNTWEAEYANGQTKRNEVGMPDMRRDTFNHAEKTASDRVRLKKAELCVAVAKLMLHGQKVASIDAIEDQAFALMFMPDQELINTHRRLAAEQEADDDSEDEEGDDGFAEDDEDSDEGQEKQAGEIPEAFKENIQKMKDKAKDKDDDDDDDDDGGQQKQGRVSDFVQEKIDEREAEEEGEKKQAKSKSKTSDQGLKEPKNQGGDQNAKANDNWPTKKANQQLAQMQQTVSQLEQMIQQAQGQGQQVSGQQQLVSQLQQMIQQAQGQGQQAPVMGQGQQQAPVMGQGQEQVPVMGDELDQMLAQQDCGPMAEADIELAPTGMDTEQVVLASGDEILRTLFAQDEQAEEEEVEQAQEKQARTASTRTVGTRPTAGVAKLGGSTRTAGTIRETDKLSALWQSAPDVRDAFGLK